MSFRNRLYAFFAVIAVAPLAAVAVILLSSAASDRRDRSDARLAQGFRTAFAAYDDARSDARVALGRVAADPELNRLLRSGPRDAIDARIGALAGRVPDVRAVAFYNRAGRIAAEAGSTDAVAAAAAAPTARDGRRIGTLSVSVTTADAYAQRVRRLTGLGVRVGRGDRQLAAAAPPGADRDTGVRTRPSRVPEAVGPAVTVTLLDPFAGSIGPLGEGGFATAAVLLVLLALFVIAAVIAARGLQRQVRELLEAARRLRMGEYGRKVAVRGDDSFAALGAEFNRMSEELAEKVAESERRRYEVQDAIRRVGDAFAAGLNSEGIVDLAVSTAIEACDAQAGRAVPIDTQKMRQARVGARDPDLETALEAAERESFAVGAEVGQELIDRLESEAEGEGEGEVDGGDGAAPRGDRRRASPARVGEVAAVAAPLRARVGVATDYFHDVGVVSIARRGPDFTPGERDIFAYLAGQAAVSIENAYLHSRVQRQAVTDELTGLANVRNFHDRLREEVERSRRFGHDLGLIMLDIDDFKRVNDTFGHQQGDLVLMAVGQLLRELSREIDVTSRYGGEEMTVILPETNLSGTALAAERMRAAFEDLRVRRIDGGGDLQITASFGVASLPEAAQDESSLIAAADAALYRAKREGKNRVGRAEAEPAAR